MGVFVGDDVKDMITEFGLDNLRGGTNWQAKGGFFNFWEKQKATREPTEFATGFGTVAPGDLLKSVPPARLRSALMASPDRW